MNTQNDLTGYINVFLVNNTNNFEENYSEEENTVEVNLTDNEEDLNDNEETDSDDEDTVVENFDKNQLIQYYEDDETIPYDGEDEEYEETIPDVQHITDEMKNSYCRFYVQHIYCYLKSWQTPNFDDICQTEYGGDFERCVIDYMMPIVFNRGSFNNWLFDFAYRFDDSFNYLIHYLHEMERTDLINMLYEAIPPNR
jgi:hypothetical protein